MTYNTREAAWVEFVVKTLHFNGTHRSFVKTGFNAGFGAARSRLTVEALARALFEADYGIKADKQYDEIERDRYEYRASFALDSVFGGDE